MVNHNHVPEEGEEFTLSLNKPIASPLAMQAMDLNRMYKINFGYEVPYPTASCEYHGIPITDPQQGRFKLIRLTGHCASFEELIERLTTPEYEPAHGQWREAFKQAYPYSDGKGRIGFADPSWGEVFPILEKGKAGEIWFSRFLANSVPKDDRWRWVVELKEKEGRIKPMEIYRMLNKVSRGDIWPLEEVEAFYEYLFECLKLAHLTPNEICNLYDHQLIGMTLARATQHLEVCTTCSGRLRIMQEERAFIDPDDVHINGEVLWAWMSAAISNEEIYNAVTAHIAPNGIACETCWARHNRLVEAFLPTSLIEIPPGDIERGRQIIETRFKIACGIKGQSKR